MGAASRSRRAAEPASSSGLSRWHRAVATGEKVNRILKEYVVDLEKLGTAVITR
jgi:hypothetical protein